MTREELRLKDGVSVLLNFNGRDADSTLNSSDPNNVSIHTIIPIRIDEDWHDARVYRLSDKDIDALRSTTDGKLLSGLILKTEDLL
jgi:hypothetical protein